MVALARKGVRHLMLSADQLHERVVLMEGLHHGGVLLGEGMIRLAGHDPGWLGQRRSAPPGGKVVGMVLAQA